MDSLRTLDDQTMRRIYDNVKLAKNGLDREFVQWIEDEMKRRGFEIECEPQKNSTFNG